MTTTASPLQVLPAPRHTPPGVPLPTHAQGGRSTRTAATPYVQDALAVDFAAASDEQIFGHHRLKPARIMRMVKSKAYLHSGVEIRWRTEIDDGETPLEATFHFPGGLADYLGEQLPGRVSVPTRRSARARRGVR